MGVESCERGMQGKVCESHVEEVYENSCISDIQEELYKKSCTRRASYTRKASSVAIG